MHSDKLKAACLAATLATAWLAPAPEAKAGTVATEEYYLRSTTDLTWMFETVRVVGLGSGSGAFQQYTDLHMVPGGDQYRSFIMDGGSSIDRFVVIGMASNPHLFVSMPDESVAIGREFTDLFPGVDENVIMQDLVSGGISSDFFSFVTHLDEMGFDSPPEITCDTVHFSAGVSLGTMLISTNPIPEPGLASIMVLSGLTLLYRRR